MPLVGRANEIQQFKVDRYNCGVSRWFGILLFFHAILIALMLPGLCSCWINPARETVHVHFGHAHAASEHSHAYLNQLGLANAGGFLPLLLIPVALLLKLLSATDIFWLISRFAFLHREWKPSVVPPPPRDIAPHSFNASPFRTLHSLSIFPASPKAGSQFEFHKHHETNHFSLSNPPPGAGGVYPRPAYRHRCLGAPRLGRR